MLMVEAFCSFTDTDILVELLQELHIATADDTEEWSGSDAGGGAGLAALEALEKLNRPPPPDAREPSKLLASEFVSDAMSQPSSGGADIDTPRSDVHRATVVSPGPGSVREAGSASPAAVDDGIDISAVPDTHGLVQAVLCAAFDVDERKASVMMRDKGKLLGLVLVNGVRGDHDPVVDLFELVRARRGPTLRLGWGCSHSAYGTCRFVCFYLCFRCLRVSRTLPRSWLGNLEVCLRFSVFCRVVSCHPLVWL